MFEQIEVNSERWFDLKLLMNEEFRDVINYEGLYQVSNYGRIKSLNYTCRNRNQKYLPHIIKNIKQKDGYCFNALYKNGIKSQFKTHRLVAQAFLLNDKKMPQVNHIDCNRSNNNLDNLYKLSKIKHMAKEDKEMYGNYGARRPMYDSYGRDEYGRGNYYGDHYGRRGYDMKYRGDEELDRMAGEYGRYQESRSRYGAGEETKKSLEHMLRSMEDFARMLKEEAQSQEEVNMIKQTAQRIAQM